MAVPVLLGGILVALVVIIVLLATAEDEDSGKLAPIATTVPTTGPPTTTAPAPTTAPVDERTDELAARRFFDAWAVGDAAAARRWGTSGAIEQAFDVPNRFAAELAFTACARDGDSVRCTWAGPPGRMVLVVAGGGGTEVQVVAAEFRPA
jgi:hypothetical protein